MASTHMEFYIKILSNLMIHRGNINRLIHESSAAKTIEELKSIKSLFNIHVTQVKVMRSELEQIAKEIRHIFTLNLDLDTYSHIMIKDSRTTFKILQEIEEIGATLRQTLNISIALNERKFAYRRNYAKKLNNFYRKYDDKVDFIYQKWENKDPELCKVFDQYMEKFNRRSDELMQSTRNLISLVNISTCSQISKLANRFKMIISESLRKLKAMSEFNLCKMRVAAKQHKRQMKSKFNTREIEKERNNTKMYTEIYNNNFDYVKLVVILKYLKSIGSIETKFLAKFIEANWKSRKKKIKKIIFEEIFISMIKIMI